MSETSTMPEPAPDRVSRWRGVRTDALPIRQMQWLRQRHEGYARLMADWLTLQLRMEFALQIKTIALRPAAEYLEDLSTPAHLCLFQLTPNGRAVYLNLPCSLGIAMVDRWLGGPGASELAERPLSELETGLLEPAIGMFLEKWTQYWGGGRSWKAAQTGCEHNPRLLTIKDPQEVICVLTLDAVLGETTGAITLALPLAFIKELLPASATATPESAPPASPPKPMAWNSHLEDMVVRLTGKWIGLEMTAGELAALQPGTQLSWEGGAAGEVELRIGHLPLFAGRLGTQNRHWAVQITKPISPSA